jgi:predicted TIM-barrel fold metal-dependent hydrolase
VAFAADGVRGVLESLHDEPRFLNEDDLLRLLLAKIGVSVAFRKAVKKLPHPAQVLFQQFEILDKLPVAALDGLLNALSTHFDRKDTPGGGIHDLFQTLRIALKPNCTAVADELLKEMNDTDGLVALMMDITSLSEPDRDRILFERQLRETQEAMLQRPGRIFPFVAVNTKRKSHRAVLERAIMQMGFVGVKLYPSLGFPIAGSEDMVDVIDFCADNALPITMHCNHGGFAADAPSVLFCDPEHWVDHLARRPETKICFAHFGGIEGLYGTSAEETDWTNHIIQLMEDFDNVFADLSFHVDMMVDKPTEKKYFDTLNAFLERPRVGDRILFGTDSWLLRMHLGERAYWHYFEDQLGPASFARIAEANPRRFLGIPSAGVAAGPSITSHIRVLQENRTQVGALPAAWLQAALGPDVKFIPQRFPPHWTPNNAAHKVANVVMRGQMTKSQQDAGFTVAGTLRMKELLFFRGGSPGTDQFRQQCESLAKRLCKVASDNSVGLEDSVTPASAQAAVLHIVESDDDTIATLGGVIDSQFRFVGEPQ